MEFWGDRSANHVGDSRELGLGGMFSNRSHGGEYTRLPSSNGTGGVSVEDGTDSLVDFDTALSSPRSDASDSCLDLACAGVESQAFHVFMSIVILANCVVIGIECEQRRTGDRASIFVVLENVFSCIYVIEVVMRVAHWGPHVFFCNPDSSQCRTNWFDFALAIIGAFGMILTTYVSLNYMGATENASIIRVIRLLRIIRLFRLLHFLKDMEYTVTTATVSVIRCFFLVFLVVFINGVIITHLLHDAEDEVVREMFGYLTTSMWHLFEVMVDGLSALHVIHGHHGSELVVITHRVSEEFPRMWIFWTTFVFLGTIALTALVPAIFVELNLRDAEAKRKEDESAEWEKRIKGQREVLGRLFEVADADLSDSVSKEELDVVLDNDATLEANGMQEIIEQKADFLMEISRVFDDLPSGQEELSREEFLHAFMRLRQTPASPEVLELQREVYGLRSFMREELQRLRQDLVR